MADNAYYQTDLKLKEMEKRLYDIVEVHVPEPAKMTMNQAPRELDAKLLDAVNYSGDTATAMEHTCILKCAGLSSAPTR